MKPEEMEEKDIQTEEQTAETQGEIPPHQDPPLEEAVSELEKVHAELEEMKDKYVRLFAEFDNFKRRSAKEKIEYMKTAGQEILSDLLPVLDDMERAEKSVASATDVEAIKEGFQLIKEKLVRNLSAKGLKAMESMGQPFNADFHEAVTEIPAPSEDLKGKVVDEIEKGYLLNEKIIRYAKVVVGK